MSLSWQDLQRFAATFCLDDLVALHRRGADALLQERVAALSDVSGACSVTRSAAPHRERCGLATHAERCVDRCTYGSSRENASASSATASAATDLARLTAGGAPASARSTTSGSGTPKSPSRAVA